MLINKSVLIIALYKLVLYSTCIENTPFRVMLVIFSLVSIVAGSLFAIAEPSLLRFLTFTSIVQNAMALITFSCCSATAFQAGFAYIITYFILLLGLFAICCSIQARYLQLTKTFSFVFLFEHSWSQGLLVSFYLFAFIGLPPFVLFFTKLYMFIELFVAGYFVVFFILVIVNSLTCFYYILLLLSGATSPDKFLTYTVNFILIESKAPDNVGSFITEPSLYCDDKDLQYGLRLKGMANFLYSLFVASQYNPFSLIWRLFRRLAFNFVQLCRRFNMFHIRLVRPILLFFISFILLLLTFVFYNFTGFLPVI